MLRNYLKIALRNLRRQFFYASLNVLGLSLGIASVLLILLYVTDELSYDRFYPQADRIVRIAVVDETMGNEESRLALTPDAVAGAVQREISEVVAATRIYRSWETVRYGEKVFVEREWQYTDSSFFSVFGYELIEGDPSTALQTPHTVVLVESVARKYFGAKPALGKTLLVGRERTPYRVTGVMEAPPTQTHLEFTMLASILSTEAGPGEDWGSYALYTYARLAKGATATALKERLRQLADKYVRPSLAQDYGIYLEDDQKTEDFFYFYVQPIVDIHLRSDLLYDMSQNGSIQNIYVLSAIAIFILVLACINFMNLSTARYMNRAKEVGIRKTLGSPRRKLILQFLAESILLSAFATVLAIFWVLAALYPFATLADKSFSFTSLLQPQIIGATLFVMLVVGLLAGSYPALYLSSFRPAEVLRGGRLSSASSSTIRHALVIFQFAMSIALTICTLLVYQQLMYTRAKQLGFDKENVLIVANADQLSLDVSTFMRNLEQQATVQQATASTSVIPGISEATLFRKPGSDQNYLLTYAAVDENFIDTYGMAMLEGRNFSSDYPADTARVIINETAQRTFELDDPIGSSLAYQYEGEEVPYEVVGVMKDFHYESLHYSVQPMAFFLDDQIPTFVSVRLGPGDPQRAVETVENAWKSAAPGVPFEYSFLDEDYDDLFKAEQRLSRVFTVFTVLAIIIACLGLLGLAAFSAEQRTKEIGVRKTMGASSLSVLILLSKDFTRLVLIAFVIAIVPAYYAMQRWLDSFAYHTDIGIGTFALAGLVALLVAWITVSYQSWRAANTNPARLLRNE